RIRAHLEGFGQSLPGELDANRVGPRSDLGSPAVAPDDRARKERRLDDPHVPDQAIQARLRLDGPLPFLVPWTAPAASRRLGSRRAAFLAFPRLLLAGEGTQHAVSFEKLDRHELLLARFLLEVVVDEDAVGRVLPQRAPGPLLLSAAEAPSRESHGGR